MVYVLHGQTSEIGWVFGCCSTRFVMVHRNLQPHIYTRTQTAETCNKHVYSNNRWIPSPHHPIPVHNQTDPSPAPPCGQSRMMQACGCRGPAGSWNTWPAGRPKTAWGGLRRPTPCAVHCPPRPRPEGGCCCPRQDCRGGKSWLGTAATRSQAWARHSSSTGPEGRAYTLTGWLVCWEEKWRRKGRCSCGAAHRERSNWRLGVWLWG